MEKAELKRDNPLVGYSLVSSVKSDVAEVLMLIDATDNFIEDIIIKTFGSETFKRLSDFVVSSLIGIGIEDAHNIDAGMLAQEYGLDPSEYHLAHAIERAVVAAINNYISKNE